MDGPFALPSSLHEACDRLVARFRPLRVVLFGSWASGTARPDSDVDLLVVMPAPVDRRQAAIDMRRALQDLPISKDIIVATPDDLASRGNLIGTVLSTALREGRVLFERA
jgi:predicted nucleotidyltransferase